MGGALNFGVPITESDIINFGGRYEHTTLHLFDGSPAAYIDFVRQFGFVTNTYIATIGWSRDTRDSVLFPTRGLSKAPSASSDCLSAPAVLQGQLPRCNGSAPIALASSVLMLRSDLGYGGGIADKTLPFFKASMVVASVRCAAMRRPPLGPQRHRRESHRRPSARSSATRNCFFRCRARSREINRCVFRYSRMQARSTMPDSARARIFPVFGRNRLGLLVRPVGPLKFSYGVPINKKVGDKIQHFQFQVEQYSRSLETPSSADGHWRRG